jgi:hypothetical protein
MRPTMHIPRDHRRGSVPWYARGNLEISYLLELERWSRRNAEKATLGLRSTYGNPFSHCLYGEVLMNCSWMRKDGSLVSL